MVDFTIEIKGEDRGQLAQELEKCLAVKQGKVQLYAETEKVWTQ